MLLHLLIIFVPAIRVETRRIDYVSTIQPPSHTSWGEWGDEDFCSDGQYAYGFRLKVQPEQGKKDDTAVNGIQLNCKSGEGSSFGRGASSTVGPYGSWGYSRNCGGNRFLVGAVLRSEAAQGKKGDDTAVNNVDFYCQVAEQRLKLQGSGLHYGGWNTYKSCPRGTIVCGIQTRVEEQQCGGDDTTLNEVKLFCCRAPQLGSRDLSIVYPSARDWVPTFRFDQGLKCYPDWALDSENKKCRKHIDRNSPVYYETHQCDNIYKITYWLFYGYQKGCFLIIGSHDLDWEHVTLNFKRCEARFCIDSIHYAQHGGWYTRQYDYEDEGRSVDVYVGKISHGNYHNDCCARGCDQYCHGGCEYWHDFRNPGNTWSWKPHNIKSIQEAINDWGKVGKKIRDHHMRNQCDLAHCDKNGCSRNNWRIYH